MARAWGQVVSAGADGLVKLWGVRTSECTATFDEHEGKVGARRAWAEASPKAPS